MSRIGKLPVKIPSTVSVFIKENLLEIRGKQGALTRPIPSFLHVELSSGEILLSRLEETRECKAFHGLYRALIANMIKGVTESFSKTLLAEGVGYKFQVENKEISLTMGFSHPVKVTIPDGIQVKLESPTKLSISGIEKEKVGALAAQLRSIKPPEPYKGKGISYQGERILRKAGKTGKK
jgi:large subunit ribosomal protein L6